MGTRPWELLVSALVAYAAGTLVIYRWARALQRRHGLDEPRVALAPALLGGALGGSCALLSGTADQMDVLGL